MDEQLNVRVTTGLRDELQGVITESEWFNSEAEAVRYAIRQLLQQQRRQKQ